MTETQTSAAVTPRLKSRYREEILPALQSEFDIKNVMQVPGLTKIGFRRDEVTKRRPDGSTYSSTRSVRVSRKTGKEI